MWLKCRFWHHSFTVEVRRNSGAEIDILATSTSFRHRCNILSTNHFSLGHFCAVFGSYYAHEGIVLIIEFLLFAQTCACTHGSQAPWCTHLIPGRTPASNGCQDDIQLTPLSPPRGSSRRHLDVKLTKLFCRGSPTLIHLALMPSHPSRETKQCFQ